MVPVKINCRTRVIQMTCGVVVVPLVEEAVILVKEGQEIETGSVIAKTKIIKERCELNLAEDLGVSGGQTTPFLVKRVGDKIVKGETLAVKKKFLGEQKVVSPIAGLICAFSPQTGSLVIESSLESANVISPISGKICQIEKETGIGVQAVFSGILGIIGLGSFVFGNLKMVKIMGGSCRGCIVVVPGHIEADVLYKALGMGVSGIIAGSIHLSDFVSFEQKLKMGGQNNFSLLITEGFGLAEMGQDIVDHLAQFENQMVILAGEEKKLIIPQKYDSDKTVGEMLPTCDSLTARELKVGDKVRLVENKNFGKIGEVISIDSQPALLPSGLKATLVKVALGRQMVSLPTENIEILF